MFVPSLFVTPLVLWVAYFWRKKSEAYPRFWWTAVVICLLLTIFYNILVLVTPLYSQQDHSPDNPGGFSGGGSLPAVLAILFFAFCIVFPSFPTLFGLAFLPPRNLRIGARSAIIALLALYVVVSAVLIYDKHVRYMEDYHRERAKPRQSRFERFKHLRESPAPQRRRRSQQEQQQDQQQQPRQQPLAFRSCHTFIPGC